VVRHHAADGPSCTGCPGSGCQFSIRDGFAVADLSEFTDDALLKCSVVDRCQPDILEIVRMPLNVSLQSLAEGWVPVRFGQAGVEIRFRATSNLGRTSVSKKKAFNGLPVSNEAKPAQLRLKNR